MVTNAVNTELTPEFLETLAKEERTELLDYLNNYPFIRWMISPDRPYAKDLERDSEGKIIVNVVKPHILENMDYFRKPALAFKKHGKYTNLRPNGNPNSPYMKWLRKEVLKCWYGCKRPSDGEWITGYHYFYLNYSPIERATANIKDTNAVNRVVDFPDIYDGDYIFYHYINQARYGGMYNEYKGGQHSALIAARGKGKSFKVASMATRNFILGENKEVCEKVKSVVVASNTEYLRKDGTLNKILAMTDFLALNTQYPSSRLKSSNQEMHWIMGFKDTRNKDVALGTRNEIIGLSLNNDSDKARGKRPVEYNTKILTPSGYILAKDLKVGDTIYGDDGKETKIIAIPFDGEDDLYKITLKDGRSLVTGKDHEFEIIHNNSNGKKITEILPLNKILELKRKNKNDIISIRVNSIVEFKEQKLKIHPYVMGLFLGDGCYRKSNNNTIDITMSVEDMKSILKFIPYKVQMSKFRDITHKIEIGEDCSYGYLKKILTEYGLKNRTCSDKFIPKEYLYNSKENRYELLRGLLDTDGNCTLENAIEYCTKSKQLKEDIMFLIRSLGINCTCYLKNVKGKIYYRVRIFATNKHLFHLKRKQDRVRKKDSLFSKATTDRTTIKSIEYCKKGKCRCFTVDNKSHLFLAGDFIITHNSHLMIWEEFGMFPGFIDAWNTSRPNVEEGGYSFGQAIALGTGGCICAGSKVFTNSGDIKNIEDLKKEDGIIGYDTKLKEYSKETISYIQPLQKKECVEITTSFNKKLRCSIDHPIFVKGKFIEARNLKIGDRIKIVEEIPLFGTYNPKYPRVIGWVIGDGSYGNNQSTRLSNCEPEILDFIKNNFEYNIQKEHITKLGKTFQEIAIKGFNKYLREEGIYGQTKLNKTFPNKIGQYSKEALSELIGGFFDTDGYVNLRKADNKDLAEISISSASKELLSFLGLLLIKFGIHGRIRERLPRKNNPKDKHSWFEYTISDSISLLNFCHNIKLYPKVKQERLNRIKELFSTKNPTSKREEKIIDIKNIGLQTIYNLTADNTHTYIANGIVTHNTEGSDFSGALEMIYNPLGYNVYGVPNMFDKGTSGGSKSILFIGEYMNRKGCYDKNGNSDVIKAVLEEVKERVFIKYNSTDPSTIAQRIAEHPMSIQEAVMRRDGTLFPVADLTDHLNYIESNKIEWHRGHLVGELYQDPEGNISFRPTDDDPIRDFPLKDNRHKGALEIYELPKEVNGKVPSYRYVGGIDPIDDDHSTTVSLPSIFILDMFTDRIVAEYTGRPDFADDFYEICRRLAIFYNASLNYENDKKGLFTYFSNHHCTHLLCDTPDILRDVELVKSSMYGNKSKGTNSGKQVNAYARRLIRDWLLMPVKQTKVELDEHGDEVEKITTVKNLQRLRGIALIKELIMWNPDINADRVSALGMLMIIRENNMKYLPGEGTSIGKKTRKNYLGNDPFFTSNFADNSFW